MTFRATKLKRFGVIPHESHPYNNQVRSVIE